MMWAITSYYNPAGYERRRRNYDRFRKHLAVPLVTVELSFDGRFELDEGDADILIRVSGGAVLWQKERLLNFALSRLPSGVDNVAWLDCDVIFENDEWVARAEAELERQKLIQLFSAGIDLRPQESDADLGTLDIRARSKPSMMKKWQDRGANAANSGPDSADQDSGFMGFAWAAKRELLEQHGFYDEMIIGGGAGILIRSACGTFDAVVSRFHMNASQATRYRLWAHRFHQAVGSRIGLIEGLVFHLWHGEIVHRNYLHRHRLLAEQDFDIDRDLRIGANGAWHWAVPRPELEAFFKKYFHDRVEDSVPENADAAS